MKRVIMFIFLIISLISCNQPIDCNYIYNNQSIEREISMNSNKFINGFSIDSRSKMFDLKCLLNAKGENIIDMFKIDSIETVYKFKVKNEYLTNFNSKDSIYCLFWDSRKLMMNYATKSYIKIRIFENKQPCDSIKEIIYTSVSETIDKLTKENVRLADLYDKVLDNKINEYLNSLNTIQKKELTDCKKTYKLLDWVENSKKYGFKKREYKLTSEIKHFLKIIAEIVVDKTNNDFWKHKKFSINIVGFADERKLGSSVNINNDEFGFPIQERNYVYINNCNKNTFLTIGERNGFKIWKVKDNCELSWLRAYSSALFLNNEFKNTHLKNNIEIKYKGGDVSSGKNYVKNRKIDVKIQLKAGSN